MHNNNNNNNNKYINIYIKVQLVKESNRRTSQAGASDLAAKLLKRDYSFHLQRSNG